MARERYTAEEIICHLRTVEIEACKDLGIADVFRKLGITEQTYYRWKKDYGGLGIDQAKQLKGLEQENARLKRLVADLSLDNSILKEVAAGHFSARPDAEKRCAMHRRRSRSLKAGRVEWWGNAELPSSMCQPHLRARTDCGHGSSRCPVNMAAMDIGESRPCSSRKSGARITSGWSGSDAVAVALVMASTFTVVLPRLYPWTPNNSALITILPH